MALFETIGNLVTTYPSTLVYPKDTKEGFCREEVIWGQALKDGRNMPE